MLWRTYHGEFTEESIGWLAHHHCREELTTEPCASTLSPMCQLAGEREIA